LIRERDELLERARQLQVPLANELESLALSLHGLKAPAKWNVFALSSADVQSMKKQIEGYELEVARIEEQLREDRGA
jgi:hypothetical protein